MSDPKAVLCRLRHSARLLAGGMLPLEFSGWLHTVLGSTDRIGGVRKRKDRARGEHGIRGGGFLGWAASVPCRRPTLGRP